MFQSPVASYLEELHRNYGTLQGVGSRAEVNHFHDTQRKEIEKLMAENRKLRSIATHFSQRYSDVGARFDQYRRDVDGRDRGRVLPAVQSQPALRTPKVISNTPSDDVTVGGTGTRRGDGLPTERAEEPTAQGNDLGDGAGRGDAGPAEDPDHDGRLHGPDASADRGPVEEREDSGGGVAPAGD